LPSEAALALPTPSSRILGAFFLGYVALTVLVRGGEPFSPRRFWPLYGLLTALLVAELPFARAPAFVLGLYLAMIGVAKFGARAVPIVAGLTLASIFVPAAIPSWHQSLSSAIGNFTPIAIPVVALVTFIVSRGVRDALELAEARAQLALLATDIERNRIARDLHDLLGHSLTTITLKADLAHCLSATEPAQAAQEIAEVAELSRRALAEVRAAVSNYREVTLAGELARGRELLRASGVVAELPTATDVVDVSHQELFGWALREGLTNVARHAHATRCTVVLTASEVEIPYPARACAPREYLWTAPPT
jgi:two-component system sensor histidine kinase DesK